MATDKTGRATRYAARAKYRDFDGTTNTVEAQGRTKTVAENALRNKLKARSPGDGRGNKELTAMHRFSAALALWMATFDQAVADGTRSSSAGERVFQLPSWAVGMLRARFAADGRLDQPVFPDTAGGFRDPANTRRDLRDARSPVGGETRQLLGKQLRAARRTTKRTQSDVASALNWPKSRVSLVETARVRLSPADATTLLDLYDVAGAARESLLGLVQAAADSTTDALAWITSHSFRKTVATILDEAGQSGRQVADQLGHARASMTQDHYIGRKILNPAGASALDAALEQPDGPIV